MTDFSLTPYREDHRDVWDGVVHSSRNGNFLHLRDYMEYHAYRFDEQSVIVSKKGRPVAVFPCNRVDERIVSHGGLTYAGLIYGNDLRAADVLEIFLRIAEHYRIIGCRSLNYKAIPHVFHRYPTEEDLYALFRNGARLVRRDLSTVVPIANRIKFSDSRKNTIRKAIKHAVSLREGDFFESFHKLITGALMRFGANPVHTPQELRLLKSRFTDQIRLFGAFVGDQLFAGALVYDFGHIVHSQYLATSEEGKAVGALDYLLAHLLDEVSRQKQYFSFGISTENNGQYLNEGLVFQKEGFGGRSVVHDFYELEL